MAVTTCTSCARVFTGLGPFDQHQDWAWGGRPTLTCIDPGDLGMQANDYGQWGYPGSYVTKQTATRVRAADRPSTDFERTCTVCDATFERPRTRGRPPTKCEACR